MNNKLLAQKGTNLEIQPNRIAKYIYLKVDLLEDQNRGTVAMVILMTPILTVANRGRETKT